MQSAVVGNGIVSQPNVYPLSGDNGQYPKEGEEVGQYVGQDDKEDKSEDGKDTGLNSADAFDQGCKEGAKGEAVLYLATARKQETFYSPLGKPDLRDLPSFAHQISQGMVKYACS